MRYVRFAVLFLTFLAAMIGRYPAAAIVIRDHRNPSTQGDTWEDTAGFVVDVQIRLEKDHQVVFRTDNLSPGADPILHLLGPDASTDGSADQVAMDDDGGGNLNARLVFTPTKTAIYRLILRATSAKGAGTGALWQDGNLMFNSVPFGAAIRKYEGLREDETLTLLPLPNGQTDYPALYFLGSDGEILRRHINNGPVVITSLDDDLEDDVYLLAAKWVPLGSVGPFRLVRNDAELSGHDSDDDGLGRELEWRIGTCSQKQDVRDSWECSESADLRDTDGDAISDAYELLGKLNVGPAEPRQLLPMWGADPRHKDIFIELDFGRDQPHDPDVRLPASVAREWAAAYSETNASVEPFAAVLHAQRLKNPDLQPGIRLHIDTGIPPETPDDATIYGDWGGHDSVPPECNTEGCHRMPVNTAYSSFLKPVRKGIFHYSTTYPGGGGQCGTGIACHLSHTSLFVDIHEFGHSLGLHHYGPVSEEPEANCKVNYPSVMNYANHQPWGFSDGFGLPDFNNVALPEIGAVPNPTSPKHRALLERLRDPFEYRVDLDAGNVDWNRDGIFQPGMVPAYSNSYPGGDCEFSSSNHMELDVVTQRTPAIARLAGQVYIFYVNEAYQLQVMISNLDPFQCQPGGAPGCYSTQLVNYPIEGDWNQGIGFVAVHSFVDGEVPKLLVLFTKDGGQLWETTLVTLGSSPRFTDPVQVPTAQPVSEEISMTSGSTHAWLAYKDQAGTIWLKKRQNAEWSADRIVERNPLQPFPAVPATTSPAIFEAPDGTLYGAFPQQPGGSIKMWKRNPATGLWVAAGLLESTKSSLGKPAMAWRPLPAGAALPGRLYLYWTPRNDDGSPGPLTENWLVWHGGTFDMSFSMSHSNSWYASHGVAALSDPLLDTNVRLVVSMVDTNPETPRPDGALDLRPKADGIVDLVQQDRDDWETMGVVLCQVLAKQQGSNALECPPLP